MYFAFSIESLEGNDVTFDIDEGSAHKWCLHFFDVQQYFSCF